MAWADDAARVASRCISLHLVASPRSPCCSFPRAAPHARASSWCMLQPAVPTDRRAIGTGDDTVSIRNVPIPPGIMMCERIGDDVTTTITETREDTSQPIMAKSAERIPGTTIRHRTRDDGCCSVNFLKYVLHIYNVVLFLSGLVVGGIGIWTVISKHSYVSLMTTSTYPTLAYALIIAGVLAVIGSWLGCGGVTSENRCVLLMYVFVVMLVFLQEVGVGVLSRLYEEQVGPELKTNLNTTFLENYSVYSTETAAIDQMQIEFKCCGALRFEDWLMSEWRKDENVLKDLRLVPDSCCKTPTHLCGRRDHPSNIHYTGCIYKFLETTKDHLIILGAVGLGLSVLELFGIVLGSCLYIKLRHDFDD